MHLIFFVTCTLITIIDTLAKVMHILTNLCFFWKMAWLIFTHSNLFFFQNLQFFCHFYFQRNAAFHRLCICPQCLSGRISLYRCDEAPERRTRYIVARDAFHLHGGSFSFIFEIVCGCVLKCYCLSSFWGLQKDLAAFLDSSSPPNGWYEMASWCGSRFLFQGAKSCGWDWETLFSWTEYSSKYKWKTSSDMFFCSLSFFGFPYMQDIHR